MKTFIGLCLIVATFFVSAAEAQQVETAQTLIGIGATLKKSPDGTVEVIALIPGAPAERTGLQIGDTIYQIKSLPGSSFIDVRPLSLPDVVALIRGPIGAPVVIVFVRNSLPPIPLSIIRDKFEIKD